MAAGLPAATKETFLRRLGRRVAWTTFFTVLVASLVIGFGASGSDQTKLRAFVDSVGQWQTHTDFRQVTMQYVTRGSDALRSRPMGVQSSTWIMWIRSLPMMPKEFAVNDTSRLHYEQFSKGPLSAYLHLCTEVELLTADGTGGYLGEFEGKLGRSAELAAADAEAWLRGLKWDYPVVADAGAVQSLRSVVADAEPYKPFKVRARHIDAALRPHVASIAADLGLPADPEAMSPQQQYAVFDRLDAFVRRHDPELWRTKQVSDCVGGIWGQVFSPPYLVLLAPYFKVAEACRWVALGGLAALAAVQLRRARRAHEELRQVTAVNMADGLFRRPSRTSLADADAPVTGSSPSEALA
jgi:hypothetical protein